MAVLRRQMSRIGGDFAHVAAIADHLWPQAASGGRLVPGLGGVVPCKGKHRAFSPWNISNRPVRVASHGGPLVDDPPSRLVLCLRCVCCLGFSECASG